MTDTCKGNKQAIKLVYSGKNTMKMKTKPLKNWAIKKHPSGSHHTPEGCSMNSPNASGPVFTA
jgi:hypothetical protein